MWYVIQVLAGTEESVCELCRGSIDKDCYEEIFTPYYIVRRKVRGEWCDVKKVLFPGYFFVVLDNPDKFAEELKKIYKTTKPLKKGEEIVPITEEEQKYLEDMLDEKHVMHVSTGYLIGDEITILEGSLRDKTGLIKYIDRHKRIAEIEIDIFGRSTRVQVGLEVVKKVTIEQHQDMIEQQKKHVPKVGEVRVLKGIFAGITGTIAEYREKEVDVNLMLYGAQTKVTFGRDEIEVVE